jgi:hypothetical protein
MSGKRRHFGRMARLEALSQEAKVDAVARGVAVDPGSLAPRNSYSSPDFVERGYYVDKPFSCQECGKPQIWTAEQQKWWYEVAKGSVLSTATRCRACRQQERARKEEVRLRGGDPNPYKNPGLLLARLRREIEPRLLSVGYQRVGRNPRGARHTLFVDYTRCNEQFTLSWDQHRARLTARRLTAGGADVEEIAKAEFDGVMSTSDIEARLAPFKVSVGRFLDAIRGPMQEPQSQGQSSASDNSSDGIV